MNLFVESLMKTREAYAQYANKMAWLDKFLDSLTITGTNVDAGSVRETLKMHVIYFIQGAETFEDFKQWVLPLGAGNLLDDDWWNEYIKEAKNDVIGDFNNNTFVAPAMVSDYTLLSGGYIKKGKIVYVHMVVKATGSAYTIATNLPQPKIANQSSGRGAYLPNNLNKNITVNANTALYIGESLPANTEFIITGTYICV